MTAPIILSTIANRYQITELVGRGSMGVVYRATDRLNGQVVALKRVTLASERTIASTTTLRGAYDIRSTIHMSAGVNSQFRLALAQEFKTLASLRHPNIISVLDYGFDQDGQPFFTMDFLNERRTVVEAGEHQPIEAKVEMVIEILQALVYLHRRGIVHRDLKPENVLVSEGRARVLDFGISVNREEAQGIAGTLAYMAPEVLIAGRASEQSDLYSVGVIAYEVMTGDLPFDSSDVTAALLADPDLTRLAAYPDISQVVERLLSKTPEERYPDAQAAIRAFNEAIGRCTPTENVEIRESFLRSAAFIGRDTELVQLSSALEDAVMGQGSVWLVGGESGIGKSRLLNELATVGLVRGATVLKGQANESGASPYAIWREPVRRLLLSTMVSDEEAETLKTIVSDIDTLIGRPVREYRLDDHRGELRLIQTIVTLLRRQQQPLLLMLEDLQWAWDSLPIIRQVSDYAPIMPVLVVCTFRDDEAPTLPESLPNTKTIRLRRLSDEHIIELSESMLGESGTKPQVVNLLKRETEGNIFFLVEVVRALAEDAGTLDEIGLKTLPDAVFAHGIQTIIQRRLARIPLEDQPLLQLAAVLGRQIDPQVLQAADENTRFEHWLAACSGAAILEVVDREWQFTHDKLREGILHDLEADAYRALNESAARAIERIYPDDAAQAIRLANHWLAAGHPANAARHAVVAGRTLLALSNPQEAQHLLSSVLDALGPESAFDPQRLVLLRLSGDACERIGSFSQANGYYEQSMRIATRVGDDVGHAEAMLGLGCTAYLQGHYAVASEYLQLAFRVCLDLGSQQEIAKSLYHLGMATLYWGNLNVAWTYLDEAYTVYEQATDRHGMALALHGLGLILQHQGDYPQAETCFQNSLSMCRDVGDRQGMSMNAIGLGTLRALHREYDVAIEIYNEALAVLRDIGYRFGAAQCLALSGAAHRLAGNLAQAEAYLQQSVSLSRSMSDYHRVATTQISLALVISIDGRLDAARALLRGALQYNVDLSLDEIRYRALHGFAEVAFQHGDFKQAAEWVSLIDNTLSGLLEHREDLRRLRADLISVLGDSAFEEALKRGSNASLDQVVAGLLADV